jgi:hypothetical protein
VDVIGEGPAPFEFALDVPGSTGWLIAPSTFTTPFSQPRSNMACPTASSGTTAPPTCRARLTDRSGPGHNFGHNLQPPQAHSSRSERFTRSLFSVQAALSQLQRHDHSLLKSLGSASSPWVQIPLPPRRRWGPTVPPAERTGLPGWHQRLFYGHTGRAN